MPFIEGVHYIFVSILHSVVKVPRSRDELNQAHNNRLGSMKIMLVDCMFRYWVEGTAISAEDSTGNMNASLVVELEAFIAIGFAGDTAEDVLVFPGIANKSAYISRAKASIGK